LKLQPSAEISAVLESRLHWILDGAIGTELERRGYPSKLPLWTSPANIERSDLVEAIHQEYLEAGATIITANTFRSSYYTYEKGGRSWEEAKDACRAAIRIARSTVSSANILVAASLAPLEDCYKPRDTPSDDVLRKYHSRQVQMLASFNPDMILAETINNSTEALIIAELCADLGFPYMISLITDGKGMLLSGEDMIRLIAGLEQYSPLAILLNCRPAEWINNDMLILKESASGIFGAYANAPGKPDDDGNWTRALDDVPHYIEHALMWKSMGARIIGGCCGTTPEYIKNISAHLLP